MTRTLSHLLQTNEVDLRTQLHQLERASGHQSNDIRLQVAVTQAARQKVHALGLDKQDTTAKELYQVLMQRVTDDDRRLERALQTRAATYVSAEAKLDDGIVHALEAEVVDTLTMALKAAAARRLFKKNPAKKLVKALGYRSFDAMLRQESPALLIAVAQHVETAAWRRAWLDGYKQLKAADFETRAIQILHPSSERWQTLAAKLVNEEAHTILTTPEMGSLIVLPLPSERPAGMVIATMALAIHELNALSAAANYLRAAQLEADFGVRVRAVAMGQVMLKAPHMPQALPWQLLQRYFATTKAVVNEDIFGPYVQAADFYWHDVEATLAKIAPTLAFWEGSSHLSFLHDGQAVSLNIVDAAINSCNKLAYEARGAFYAQQSLWNELCLKYVHHESIEQAVSSLLHPQLAYEPALNK